MYKDLGDNNGKYCLFDLTMEDGGQKSWEKNTLPIPFGTIIGAEIAH